MILKKVIVFESTFFCFIPIEFRHKLWMGFVFLWLSWFPPKNYTCVNLCITVYMRQKLATFGIYEILGPTFAAFRPTQQKTRHKLSSVYCWTIIAGLQASHKCNPLWGFRPKNAIYSGTLSILIYYRIHAQWDTSLFEVAKFNLTSDAIKINPNH